MRRSFSPSQVVGQAAAALDAPAPPAPEPPDVRSCVMQNDMGTSNTCFLERGDREKEARELAGPREKHTKVYTVRSASRALRTFYTAN